MIAKLEKDRKNEYRPHKQQEQQQQQQKNNNQQQQNHIPQSGQPGIVWGLKYILLIYFKKIISVVLG